MLDLATHCIKINVWRNKHYLIHYQKVVYIGHIKNPMTHCTQLPQQRQEAQLSPRDRAMRRVN